MLFSEYIKKNFKPYSWQDSIKILEKNYKEDYPKTQKLILVIGAYGAGKSTLITNLYKLKKTNLPYINAECFAKKELKNIKNEQEKNKIANKITNEKVANLIKNKSSFVYETDFSLTSKLDLIETAYKSGYEIIVFYLTTQNVNINIDRVQKRVVEGGNSIDQEKIISSYKSVEPNAKKLIALCHRFYLFDNSKNIKFDKKLQNTKDTIKEI